MNSKPPSVWVLYWDNFYVDLYMCHTGCHRFYVGLYREWCKKRVLVCPKHSQNTCFGCVLVENVWKILEKFLVFFPYKNLQLVYPPLWHGPFNENPYAKLRLGRAQSGTAHAPPRATLPGSGVEAGNLNDHCEDRAGSTALWYLLRNFQGIPRNS